MSDVPEQFTAEQVAQENWAAIEGYPKLNVECLNGHHFVAYAKFSGTLVAIVSKDPCPKCGTYSLKSASSSYEEQMLTLNDKGHIV